MHGPLIIIKIQRYIPVLVTDRLQQGDCSVHGPLIIIKIQRYISVLVTDRLQQGDCSVHGPLIIIKDTEVHIRAGDRQAAPG